MYITIGEIVKAQGIKGELKIKPLTDDVCRYKKLKQLVIRGIAMNIKSIRIHEGFVYISLDGVADRTAAEKLVGFDVQIDRVHAVDLPQDTYFISDIIGCDVVFDSGEFIGKVDYVHQNGAADVYEVKGDGNVMFPFLNRVVVSIDIVNKKIVVNKNEFIRVAVYED